MSFSYPKKISYDIYIYFGASFFAFNPAAVDEQSTSGKRFSFIQLFISSFPLDPKLWVGTVRKKLVYQDVSFSLTGTVKPLSVTRCAGKLKDDVWINPARQEGAVSPLAAPSI